MEKSSSPGPTLQPWPPPFCWGVRGAAHFSSPLGWCTQPVAGSQESRVQSSLSSQRGGAWRAQRPCVQRSSPLQASWSSQSWSVEQALHPERGVLRQPWVRSQVSEVQGSPSSQLGGIPGAQNPFVQLSIPSQALALSQSWSWMQDLQPVMGRFMQPETGLHPSVVQESLSSQSGGVPAAQKPATQVSSPSQAFPLSQSPSL